MPPPADPRLDQLARLAEEAAAGRGHQIRNWDDDVDTASSRRATCGRCGKPIYVRVGDGMTGMAGAALTEPCDSAG